MKKIILLIAVAIMWFALQTNAQTNANKPFKGIITITMKYEGDIDPATLAQLPTTTTEKIFGKYLKSELIVPGASIEMVRNGNDTTMFTLYDIMGLGKYCVRTPKDNIIAHVSEGKDPEIKYSNETKTIAGYVCQKAEYVLEDELGEKHSMDVYYNTEIGGAELNYTGSFPGLKGYPMEYTIVKDEITVITTVSDVLIKKVKLKETDFFIPSDYKEVTQEEFMQMVGGAQ